MMYCDYCEACWEVADEQHVAWCESTGHPWEGWTENHPPVDESGLCWECRKHLVRVSRDTLVDFCREVGVEITNGTVYEDGVEWELGLPEGSADPDDFGLPWRVPWWAIEVYVDTEKCPQWALEKLEKLLEKSKPG